MIVWVNGAFGAGKTTTLTAALAHLHEEALAPVSAVYRGQPQ